MPSDKILDSIKGFESSTDEYVQAQTRKLHLKKPCSFSIANPIKMKLDAFSKDSGMSSSQVVERLLEAFLEQADEHYAALDNMYRSEGMGEFYRELDKTIKEINNVSTDAIEFEDGLPRIKGSQPGKDLEELVIPELTPEEALKVMIGDKDNG